jgi:hypothetical protein
MDSREQIDQLVKHALENEQYDTEQVPTTDGCITIALPTLTDINGK